MSTTTKELAYRRDSGIKVALLWNTDTGRLIVSVADVASDEAFNLPVAPGQALDVFYHPYAYAASMGVAHTGPETAAGLYS